ncbi:MAG: sugar ABC transporter permease [Chloroflexota bacterium]|nr:sugar ABC transporter permease [Chloroflexota bacterium]
MAVQTQTLRRARISTLRRREAISGYLAIMPWLLGYLIFTAGPMLFSAYLTFTKWELLTPPRWIGWGNFQFLLVDKTFRTALWNTFLFTVLSVPLQLLVALGVALLLNLGIRGKNWYRAIIFLPSQTPIVANALLWFFIFSPTYGLANVVMDVFGLPQQRWLWDVQLVKPALIVMAAWGFGGAMIIFLAGLQNIPQSFYEAAEIDGAGTFAKFLHITIPLLSPTIFFNLVIGLIGAFQIFTPVYIMTRGGPGTASMMLGMYIYRHGFEQFNMGYASLLAWVLFVIVMLLTLLQFAVAKRWVHYEGDTR